MEFHPYRFLFVVRNVDDELISIEPDGEGGYLWRIYFDDGAYNEVCRSVELTEYLTQYWFSPRGVASVLMLADCAEAVELNNATIPTWDPSTTPLIPYPNGPTALDLNGDLLDTVRDDDPQETIANTIDIIMGIKRGRWK